MNLQEFVPRVYSKFRDLGGLGWYDPPDPKTDADYLIIRRPVRPNNQGPAHLVISADRAETFWQVIQNYDTVEKFSVKGGLVSHNIDFKDKE